MFCFSICEPSRAFFVVLFSQESVDTSEKRYNKNINSWLLNFKSLDLRRIRITYSMNDRFTLWQEELLSAWKSPNPDIRQNFLDLEGQSQERMKWMSSTGPGENCLASPTQSTENEGERNTRSAPEVKRKSRVFWHGRKLFSF